MLRSNARPPATPARRGRRPIRLLAGIAAAALVATMPGARAAGASEVVLGQRPLDLELDAAEVEVTFGDAPARLESRARAADTDPEVDDEDDAYRLDATFEGGVVRVVRPPAADEDSPRPRLSISISLAVGQRLRLIGEDLDVSLRRAPESAEAPLPRQTTPTLPHDPVPPRPLEIGVARSTVTMVGLGDAVVALEASRLRAEDGAGDLELIAEAASEAEILRHRGGLAIEASASDVVVVEPTGDAQLTLADSNVLLRHGRGTIVGTAQRGLVAVEQWTGAIRLGGEDGAVEITDASPTVSVEGSRQSVRTTRGRGTLAVHQRRGGEIAAHGWRGRAEIAMTGSGTVAAKAMAGPLALRLERGATATVAGVEALVDATLDHASLEIAGVASLEVEARDAQVTGSGIRRLAGAVLDTSRADLDLRLATAFGALAARDASHLEARLTTPCQVVLPSPAAAERAAIDGCSVDTGRAETEASDAEPHTALHIDIDETSTLIVRAETE